MNAHSSTRARAALIAALSVLCAVGVPCSASAAPVPAPSPAPPVSNPGPLLWTAPGQIDAQPLDSIVCPSATLCVAVDRGGDVAWSTDPTGGTRAWHTADIDGRNEITGIACPSTTLCVAVDGSGNAITSVAPTGGTSAWVAAKIDPSKTQNSTDNGGAVLIRGISCPSTTLCLAVDAAGNALISTAPTGGAAAWVVSQIDTETTAGCEGGGLNCQPPLVGIACPSIALCVAVDFSGNILATTSPTVEAPWPAEATAPGFASLWGVACPTTTFCATVNGIDDQAITWNPAAPTTLLRRSLPDALYGIWCASAALCLASAETAGGVSGLLGSFDPASAASVWSLSTLGAVNGVACVSPSVCLAVDDEGNLATGATTTSISAALTQALLPTQHLPTVPALLKARGESFMLASPIAAGATLTWTALGPSGMPVTLGSTHASYSGPATKRLRLVLTRAGRRLLTAATARVSVLQTATFTADTGSVTVTHTVAFRFPPQPKPKPKRKPAKRHPR